MKTYWNISVSVDGRTKSSSSKETAAEAIQQAITDAIYYQAIYPNETVAITDIKEYCSMCSNHGEVYRKVSRPTANSKFTMRCPACKGKTATGQIADIKFTMPESTNHIELKQIA
jgi:hypothetical protein